jgi:uncharacterized Zn-finger protein
MIYHNLIYVITSELRVMEWKRWDALQIFSLSHSIPWMFSLPPLLSPTSLVSFVRLPEYPSSPPSLSCHLPASPVCHPSHSHSHSPSLFSLPRLSSLPSFASPADRTESFSSFSPTFSFSSNFSFDFPLSTALTQESDKDYETNAICPINQQIQHSLRQNQEESVRENIEISRIKKRKKKNQEEKMPLENAQEGELRGGQRSNRPKRFFCPVKNCGKGFTQRGGMENHMRIHRGEKPYRCKYSGCGRAFVQKCNRTRHERLHSGEKPYLCPIQECQKRFNRKFSLLMHIHASHPNQERKEIKEE